MQCQGEFPPVAREALEFHTDSAAAPGRVTLPSEFASLPHHWSSSAYPRGLRLARRPGGRRPGRCLCWFIPAPLSGPSTLWATSRVTPRLPNSLKQPPCASFGGCSESTTEAGNGPASRRARCGRAGEPARKLNTERKTDNPLLIFLAVMLLGAHLCAGTPCAGRAGGVPLSWCCHGGFSQRRNTPLNAGWPGSRIAPGAIHLGAPTQFPRTHSRIDPRWRQRSPL